jgi:2-iminobutanoate/2-iminopropanoate deaminase
MDARTRSPYSFSRRSFWGPAGTGNIRRHVTLPRRIVRDCDTIRACAAAWFFPAAPHRIPSFQFELGGNIMKTRLIIGVLLLTALAVAQSDRKFLTSKLATEKHLPFSSGVLVGPTLYIAGTTADTGKLAAGLSPQEEAREIMEQIKQTTESAGMTMDDIVSVQVYCTDLALYDAFNGVYSKYFHSHFPARAFVGVAKLLFGAHFEVAGVAVAKR